MAKKLRDLLKQREKLDELIGEALKREHPVGSIVHWTHGSHHQDGRVVEHWGDRLRAVNINTNKAKDLSAFGIDWYEQRHGDGGGSGL